MSFMDYYEGRERERAEAEEGTDIDTLDELLDEEDD